MAGYPIKDLCPGCGGDGGKHHDWFPELGELDDWLCGTNRGIDKYSGQRVARMSPTCQRIRDLKARVAVLERFALETAFPEHPNGIDIDDDRDHEQRATDLCRELGLKSEALRPAESGKAREVEG